MEIKGAKILIETLIEQGVELVFGYPGGTVIDIYDELYKVGDRIKHVLTCHEQGATHAADGYARSTGKVGVAIATSGPGATNTVTGIATAFIDSTPLVVITGNVALNMIGRDSFQEVDITGVTIPVTKHNYMVKDIKELAPTLREAFKIAKSGRPGPVLVDIPKDVQNSLCEFIPQEPLECYKDSEPKETELEYAVKLICESKRPFIYTGGGVVISEATEELQKFASKINCPIGATIMGITALPWNHPNFIGMMGMHGCYTSSWAVNEADLIIAIGTRFSDRVTGNKQEFAKNAKILHIDIDQAEIGKNISVFMSLVGNIKNVITDLTNKLDEAGYSSEGHSAWLQKIEEIKSTHEHPFNDNDNKIHPWNLIEKICKHVGDKFLVATDVGQHQMWAAQYFKFLEPRTFITSGGLGTMGFGMGAAIGAYLGKGYKTILVTGDGSFHMNMNELATMVTYKLPIVIFVFNNNVLGMVRQWQSFFYEKRFSNTTLDRKTDYVKFAEAFGATGFRITCAEEAEDILKQAFALEGPVVIDCKIDSDEMVLPMIPAGGSIKNIITRNNDA